VFQKFPVIILVLIISQLFAKPFKDITSIAQLDSMSVFSFAIMSDNKGDALNKKEFKRMDKWIKGSGAEFVVGLGDHVKRGWKNQFVDFLKEDRWWYTKFYPVLADGENEYYGESQADRTKGNMLFDLTDMKERGNIEFTEEGSEYYAKIKVKDYTIHLISLFYPDSPSDDRVAFPDESKKYLVDILNSIDKKKKDIIIAAAHSRMGYWLNNLPYDKRDVVLNKVDLVLSATTHVFQVFNSYGDEIVPLAINTGSITYPNLFCPGGYVQVNVVEDPDAFVVQYINAEKKDRKLQNTYYSAVKKLNGEVVSTNFSP
jgi:predicted phosphodiesterase